MRQRFQPVEILRGGLVGQGRIQGGGRSPLLKPKKVTFFIVIFYNSENNIRDARPFCRPLFCHSCVVSILHLSYSSEPVMRLDCQMLLKSIP